MAAVGLIESLLTLQLVDGLVDDGTQGSTSAECRGQGVANVLSGLSGGMGGCALIGQSLINIDSGGTSRLSGVVMSSALALGVVVGAPLLAAVTIASRSFVCIAVRPEAVGANLKILRGKICVHRDVSVESRI